MSTEWLQIIITCAIVVPLIVLVGRVLYWRQWDRERREARQLRRGVREIVEWAEWKAAR